MISSYDKRRLVDGSRSMGPTKYTIAESPRIATKRRQEAGGRKQAEINTAYCLPPPASHFPRKIFLMTLPSLKSLF
jgi:hypothetical protein